MALATGAAAIAGASAAGAYLNAKYHISKDLAAIRTSRKIVKLYQTRAAQKRHSLWYFFEEWAAKLTTTPCLWYRTSPSEEAVRYTWTETYEQCLRWANFLLDLGLQPGELVGTYLQNSPDFMFNLFGSWAIGTAPALINYNLGGDGLVHCLKVANTKVLLVDEDAGCQERVDAVRSRIEGELGMRIVVIDAATKAAINSTEPKRPDNSYRDGVAGTFPIFLFYTSGTTGMPKACPFQTQRSYILGEARLKSIGLKSGTPAKGTLGRSNYQPPKAGDVWYDCMPLYHGTGCTIALSCMITGLTLAIGRKFSVRNFWPDIHDSGAYAFVYVGETARYLLAAPPSRLDKGHKLKAMYGNGMRPDVWRRFQERFDVKCVNEFFNSTEGVFGLLNVCNGPFHEAHVGHHGAIQRWQLHHVFVPVEIDHENGEGIWRDPRTGFAKRKTYEEGGEIIVQCPTEASFWGYWRNPEATQKRFERDVFRKGDLYYRTGDALRRDADGRWFFLDRLGDTFRWKSENVSTAEVAQTLGQFPGLVEANVYGVEVPGHDGRAGCAAIYVRPEERQNFDWAGLLLHARRGLPKYAVPVFLRMVKHQTPMHNNKQNKVPLRNEGIDPAKIAEGTAGREDELFWLPPGSDTYVPFGQAEYDSLVGGKARL